MDQTIERIEPLWQNDEIFKQRLILHRYQDRATRWYYQLIDGAPVLYPSVTSIINKSYPEPDYIIKLKADMGLSKFYQWLNEKAHFGTFIHERLSETLIDGFYDFSKLHSDIDEYTQDHKLNFDNNFWHYDAPKYLHCFFKFFNEVNIEPLAIELPIIYDETITLGYASLIDCVAYIDVKKGKKTERKLVLLDWKTGTNFFPHHELQLQMYAEAFYGTYMIEADLLMNVIPNATFTNYKTKTYDQITTNEIMHYVRFYNKLVPKPQDILINKKDMYKLGEPVSDVFEKITAEQFIINKHKNFKYEEAI